MDDVSERMVGILVALYDMMKTSLKRWQNAKAIINRNDKENDPDSMLIDSFQLLCVRFKLKNIDFYDENFLGFSICAVHFDAGSVSECLAMSVIAHIAFNISHPVRLESVFEALEFLLGIRRRTTLPQVRSFLNELPPNLVRFIRN